MTKQPMTITEFARLGGHARAESLTRTERRRIAKKAIRVRWNVNKAKEIVDERKIPSGRYRIRH